MAVTGELFASTDDGVVFDLVEHPLRLRNLV